MSLLGNNKFFGYDLRETRVRWFKDASKKLTTTYEALHENKSEQDLAIPFYVAGIGRTLTEFIILNKKKVQENPQLFNIVTFALLGLADIMQNNTAAYRAIRQGKGKLGGSKQEFVNHLLGIGAKALEEMEKNPPEYGAVKQKLDTLQSAIEAKKDKINTDPVAQLHSLCAIILGGESGEMANHLNKLGLKNTSVQRNSVFRKMDAGGITLSWTKIQSKEENLARSIVSYIVVGYTQEMLNYGPILERLGT